MAWHHFLQKTLVMRFRPSIPGAMALLVACATAGAFGAGTEGPDAGAGDRVHAATTGGRHVTGPTGALPRASLAEGAVPGLGPGPDERPRVASATPQGLLGAAGWTAAGVDDRPPRGVAPTLAAFDPDGVLRVVYEAVVSAARAAPSPAPIEDGARASASLDGAPRAPVTARSGGALLAARAPGLGWSPAYGALRPVRGPIAAARRDPPNPLAPGVPSGAPAVTVRVGAAAIEVGPGFDPALLRAVVEALARGDQPAVEAM